MIVQLLETQLQQVESDVLLVPLFEDDDFSEGFPKILNQKLDGLPGEIRDQEPWQAKEGKLTVIRRPRLLAVGRLILVGAGLAQYYDAAKIRTLVMQSVHQIKGRGFESIAVWGRGSCPADLAAQAAVEGVILGSYVPDKYKTLDRFRYRLQTIFFASDQKPAAAQVEQAIKRGEILARATNRARNLINEPGNRIGPLQLAEQAQETADKFGLQVEILTEPEMEDLGMHAVQAVARGSDEPARFVILKHLGASDGQAPSIVLIGKGVTFDAGGISLKPAQSMEEMKADKAGACVVLAAMQAIAQLQLAKNVVGIMPVVENLPGGRAQRPGDVIESMSGKTIEVVNTDAEGRLILADALHYAQRFNPACLIDIATLTGACIVALGKIRAGLFCNNEPLCSTFLEVAERTGEKFWRLPLDAEYRPDLDSSIADLKNVGNRWGGAITAAKFLEEFVEGRPWCHLDIAGVDLFPEKSPIQGPTGFGVRTLAEFALRFPVEQFS